MPYNFISILLPVKNTAQFLPQCLNSIINQTEKNWELIAINDHSTDSSLNILKNFEKQDNRIQVFDNQGDGIIKALRLAFSKSTGNLITRMDSDDIMIPQKLELMKNELVKNGEGHLVVGMVEYFKQKKEIGAGYLEYQNWLNHLTENNNHFTEIYKECVIPSPCWMTYKNDLMRCYSFQPNTYPEDYDLCFRFYKYGLKTIGIPQVVHLWRDYDTRTSRTNPNYSDNRFLDLKLRYFLELDFDKTKNLVIWGAGKKGKMMAKFFITNQVPFFWVCDNDKKIGKDIYDTKLHHFTEILKLEKPQILISVANKEAQSNIIQFLKNNHFKKIEDYFFFC